MFAKFSGVESERTISKFRKKKYNFCLAFTCPIKWVCKIRKFHVAAVQRWKRIMQRAWWMFSLLSPSSLVLFSSRNNSATMVMWRHTSPLYSTKFRKTMNQYILVPRPVRAIRVTRGGLEPSAIANFPDKLDRWRHIRNRRGRLGTRLEPIDIFTDTVAILNSLDLRSIMGCPGALAKYLRALFGQKENFTVYFPGKRHSLLHPNTAQRSFFPIAIFF